MCMHVHTLYSLPTRPHRWQIAGQGETHTYTSLPTRQHRWQIAGKGETHTYTHPCLPDHTDGSQGETHIPAYQTTQMADHRSERYGTHSCTHILACSHVHTLWVHVLLKPKLRFAETVAGFDGLVV